MKIAIFLKTTLLTGLFSFFFVGLNAQQVVTIGTGNETDYRAPYNGYYDYSWSNVVYLASEINYSGHLNSVSFHVDNAPSNFVMNNQKIYVRHTTETSYSSSNYTGTNGYELVFEGTITYSGAGWKTITFDTPFSYNGSENLEFLFENHDGTYANGFPYFKHSLTGSSTWRTKRDYQDNNFPSVCYLCHRVNSRPNIQLSFSPCSTEPLLISAINTTLQPWETANLTVSQQPANSSILWEVSQDNTNFSSTQVTSTSYETAEIFSTRYYRVKASIGNCVSYSNVITITVDNSQLITKQIGTGTNITNNFPLNNYYDYSWSSTLYLSEELNTTGTLSRISFHVDQTPANRTMKDQRIYVRHSQANDYTTNTYPGTADFQLVYQGSITFEGAGWKSIDFQLPFHYNGTDNLEFLFENHDGTWQSSIPYFRVTTGSAPRTKRDFKDGNFPSNCNSCNRVTGRPNVKLDFVPCSGESVAIVFDNHLVTPGDSVVLTSSELPSDATLQWQYSTDNLTFSSIADATGNTFTTSPLYDRTYYRIATKIDQCVFYSDTLVVDVDTSAFSSTTIGDGTLITGRYPFYNYYDYSYAMMIYTKEEIGISGDLTRISVHVAQSPANTTYKNQRIYVRHTDSIAYPNGEPNYPSDTTGFMLVYDGDITYNGTGWKDIVFKIPFSYNGNSNLEFRFENGSGKWTMDYPTFYFTAGSTEQRVKRDYKDISFPTNCTYCAAFNNTMNIQLKFLPIDVEAGDVSVFPTNICKGGSTELSVVNQTEETTLLWQKSTNGTTFTSIADANEAFYITEGLDTTTHYRVRTTKNGLHFYSSAVKVDVLAVCPTVQEYDTLTSKGSITLDITGLGDTYPPYDYVVSAYPLVDKIKLFESFESETLIDENGDTLVYVLDSTFLQGTDYATTKEFNAIPEGAYYNVGVYNNQGKLIFQDKKWIGEPLTALSLTGMEIKDNFYRPTDAISKATTDLLVDLGDDFELGFDLATVKGSQSIGLSDSSVVYTDLSQMRYGLHIIGDKVYTVKEGVLSSQGTSVHINDRVTLKKIGTDLIYSVNDKTIDEGVLTVKGVYNNVVLGAESKDLESRKLVLKKPVIYNKPIGKNGPISITKISHPSCDGGSDGSFTFTVKIYNGPTYVPSPKYLYKLVNLLNNTILYTGSNVLSAETSLENIQPGIYRLETESPHGLHNIDIIIGYPANWINEMNYTLYNNNHSNNSLTRTQQQQNTYSFAETVNVLEGNKNGWYVFDLRDVVNTRIHFKGSNGGSRYIEFLKFKGTYYITMSPVKGSTLQIPLHKLNYNDNKIYCEFTNNQVKIHSSQGSSWSPNLKFSIPRPLGDIHIEAQSKVFKERIYNNLFSFGCMTQEQIDNEINSLKMVCESLSIVATPNTPTYYNGEVVGLEIVDNTGLMANLTIQSIHTEWIPNSGIIPTGDLTAIATLTHNINTYQANVTINGLNTVSCVANPLNVVIVPNEEEIAMEQERLTYLCQQLNINVAPGEKFFCEGDLITLTLVHNTSNIEDLDLNSMTLTWSPSDNLMNNGLYSVITFANSDVTTTYNLSVVLHGLIDHTCDLETTIDIDLENSPCGSSTISVVEIDGCCFNNYGAAVMVNSTTYLNVYCNIINEVASNSEQLNKGEFQNKGKIRSTKNWINNGQNKLFISNEGEALMIGDYQSLSGTSSIYYYDLALENYARKEIFTDEYIVNDLKLSESEFAAQNHSITMLSDRVNALSRTSGFISTDKENGYFSRMMKYNVSPSSSPYLYPMGSTENTYRYRPLELQNKMDENQIIDMMVHFQNSELPNNYSIDSKAPNVNAVYNQYYYKFFSSNFNDDELLNVEIIAYYNPNDGNFQAIAHWRENENETENWWAGTPGSAAISTPSNAPNTLGLYAAKASGEIGFNTEYFALSQAGFYIGTTNFGGNENDDDDDDGTDGGGVIFTVTSVSDSPDTGGGSTGGGLNEPTETGTDQPFTPSPVAGTYEMNIQAGHCTIDGKIRFTILENGTVDENSIFYIYDGQEENESSHVLASELRNIDLQNSGLLLFSKPKSIEECLNVLSIHFGEGSDFVLENDANKLIRVTDGSEALTIGNLVVYDRASTLIQTYSPVENTYTLTDSYPDGVYKFEMLVSLDEFSTVVKGQFIVR